MAFAAMRNFGRPGRPYLTLERQDRREKADRMREQRRRAVAEAEGVTPIMLRWGAYRALRDRLGAHQGSILPGSSAAFAAYHAMRETRVSCRSRGFVALRPSRAEAAVIAHGLRLATAFGPELAEFDRIAGRSAPTGSVLKLQIDTLCDLIGRLTAVTGTDAERERAWLAARVLQEASLDRMVALVAVPPSTAGALAAALRQVGADPLLVARVARFAAET